MRFHMGVSFRLKTLKKFIWPILIGFLAYFLGSGVITAKAEDYIVENTYTLNDLTFCDTPITDYVDYFNNYKGDLYDFYVSYINGDVFFTFYPVIRPAGVESTNNYYTAELVDNSSIINWLKLGTSSSGLYTTMKNNLFAFKLDSTKCNNIDFRDNVQALNDFTSWTESYYNFYDNYRTVFNNVDTTNFTGYTYRNVPTGAKVLDNSYNGSYNAFVEFDYTSQNHYLLYSSNPTYYDESPDYRDFVNPKKLNLNGILYNTGDLIDFGYIEDVNFIDSYNNLPDSYLYFDKTYIDNLGFKLQFFSPDFMNNNNIRYMLSRASGRIKNGDTYYYEPINCSINLSQASFTESNGTITFTLNGLNCSSDLTPYDYISANVVFYRNDDSILESFSHIKSSFTNGIEYLYFGGEHLGIVYQPLRNISGNFTGFISGNNNYSNILTIKSDNSWIYTQPYKLSTMTLVNPTYNEYLGSTQPYDSVYQSYGLGIDQGVLFSLDDQHRVNSVDMDLFFDNFTYLYLSELNTNQVCYYYNESYQCSNITINYDYSGSDSNDYDVSNYFGLVTNFIDGLSSDMVSFGGIVQDVYNTIPPFISSFFVVLYVLGNAYFVFKLIKR